jgi:hypothetical protein
MRLFEVPVCRLVYFPLDSDVQRCPDNWGGRISWWPGEFYMTFRIIMTLMILISLPMQYTKTPYNQESS